MLTGVWINTVINISMNALNAIHYTIQRKEVKRPNSEARTRTWLDDVSLKIFWNSRLSAAWRIVERIVIEISCKVPFPGCPQLARSIPNHTMKTSMPRPEFIFRILIAFIVLIGHIPFANSQPVTVTGTVTELGGEGIPGVNVVIKGTAIGTATDLEGRYSIAVNPGTGAVLVISFIGYDSQEIIVGQQTKIDVQLNPNLTELQEVVVTGYSTLMKKDIASSIAVVDVKDMNKIASSNFADQLQGKVAGVQIATSGEPGSFQYVRVRGIGSINNNEPLYVIDGVPVQNETNMNFLNPADIESMQVLKDASASIYGARAANGVIVITTKKGSGRTRVNFDFFTGVQDPLNFPELVTPDELMQINMAQYAGAGISFNSQYYLPDGGGGWRLPDFIVFNRGYAAGDPAVDPAKYVLNTSDPSTYQNNYPIIEANKAGTNWFEELYKPAIQTNAQVSISNGTENGTHFFSMNYYDYNGTLIENKWKRIQARLNNTFSIGKNIRVGENLNVSLQTQTGADGFAFLNVGNAYNYLSIVPVTDINGYWAASDQTPLFGANPVASQRRSAEGYEHRDFRLTGNAFVEFDFLKNFTFKTNAGVDYFQGPTEYYLYTCPECGTPGQNNRLLKNSSSGRSWVVTSTLNYNRLMGKHNLYAFVGGEFRDASSEGVDLTGTGLQFGDDPNYREIGNAQSYTAVTRSSSNSMVSAFVNVNYTFNEKYILAATLRTDGSSRFINNRFGTFAGVSGAWRISLEPFLAPVTWISDMKLRASYGSSGNNEVVGGDYPGFSAYGTSLGYSSYPISGTTLAQGFGQVSTGNPDLKWETSILTNLAVDVTLWGKFYATLEWYNRKTNDMIYGVDQPLETGNVFQFNENIGSMVNRGIDMQLTYRGRMESQDISYSIGVTGTHFTNKVLTLDANDNTFVSGQNNAPTRTQQGYPVSQLYGYAADGIWQSQEQIDAVLFSDPGGNKSGAKPGRMKFQDVDGNGVISPGDRTFIGNPLPKFILGLNVNLTYKNFDLTAYISGVFGKKVYNDHKALIDRKARLDEAGKSQPVFDLTDNRSYQQSSYFVEDGSFLKIRSVDLGYTIPSTKISKLGMSKARVYFQVQNLFTWTKYSGLDPDVAVLNMYQGSVPKRDLTTGIDVGRYPPSRQFIIGVNFEF